MSQTMPPPVFDPFAPGFTDDPYPQYAALRGAAPAGRHPFGFFLLTRYEDVSGLLRAGMSVEDRNITDRELIELREQLYGEEAARPFVALATLSRTNCLNSGRPGFDSSQFAAAICVVVRPTRLSPHFKA